MKLLITILIVAFVSIVWKVDSGNEQKPCIAFSFDDGNTDDILAYKGEVWNDMIVNELKKNNIQTVLFTCGKSLDNEKGKAFLQKWNDAGNFIANHTYNHLNYNDSLPIYSEFVHEILQCDSVIKGYQNYQKIFRFPYLKTGNTIAKRDSICSFLRNIGYRNGWVTIANSDWYINYRLIKKLTENPQTNLNTYRDFYINHIFERAVYYNNLSKEINHRQIKHTLLLHINLTSALFIGDLIAKFKKEGWMIENYSTAIKDPIYKENPSTTEFSLIWSQAKRSGKFEDRLRQHDESGDLEKKQMDKLGL